jgi:hypothetical protein
MEGLERLVSLVQLNTQVLICFQLRQYRTVDQLPLMIVYLQMLNGMPADWSYDGRLDLLGIQFKSIEDAKDREPFGRERLHIGTIGASSDCA